ncbi:MAG TPA: MEDS domain-containing protein [Candidatus Sulfotelmatobacter sp.]|nr:MEDS domain-containing protein [Candidatus Sulfotelmatobacter sp.]
MTENISVQRANAFHSFGELSPSEHIAQFYEHDQELVDTLIHFIGGALSDGESAIVIATKPHLAALEQALQDSRVDVADALIQGRYIALLADEALRHFMVNRWPDERLFTDFVTKLITRARANGRRVRAFGEMVALLWSRGDGAATLRLEELWQQLCKVEEFALFCAYPKAGFTEKSRESIHDICVTHSKVI